MDYNTTYHPLNTLIYTYIWYIFSMFLITTCSPLYKMSKKITSSTFYVALYSTDFNNMRKNIPQTMKVSRKNKKTET